jgi:hypothetical protein
MTSQLKVDQVRPYSASTVDLGSITVTGGSITGITDLAVADGGTGASTAAAARTNLGSTTVGDAVFIAANAAAARTALDVPSNAEAILDTLIDANRQPEPPEPAHQSELADRPDQRGRALHRQHDETFAGRMAGAATQSAPACSSCARSPIPTTQRSSALRFPARRPTRPSARRIGTIWTAVEGYDALRSCSALQAPRRSRISSSLKSNAVTGVFGVYFTNSAGNRFYAGRSPSRIRRARVFRQAHHWRSSRDMALYERHWPQDGPRARGGLELPGHGRRVDRQHRPDDGVAGQLHVGEHEHHLPQARPSAPWLARAGVQAGRHPARAREGAEPVTPSGALTLQPTSLPQARPTSARRASQTLGRQQLSWPEPSIGFTTPPTRGCRNDYIWVGRLQC